MAPQQRFCSGCHRSFAGSTFTRHVAQPGTRCHQIWQNDIAAIGTDKTYPDVVMHRPAPLRPLSPAGMESESMDVDSGGTDSGSDGLRSNNAEGSEDSEVDEDENDSGSCLSEDLREIEDALASTDITPLPHIPGAALGFHEVIDSNSDSDSPSPQRGHSPASAISQRSQQSNEPRITVAAKHRYPAYVEIYEQMVDKYSSEWEDPRGHFLDTQPYAQNRQQNKYWPCKSRREFEMLCTIQRLRLSEAQINDLLKTDFVR
jgi:hypothetical protein